MKHRISPNKQKRNMLLGVNVLLKKHIKYFVLSVTSSLTIKPNPLRRLDREGFQMPLPKSDGIDPLCNDPPDRELYHFNEYAPGN
jgi:hypothetical protein